MSDLEWTEGEEGSTAPDSTTGSTVISWISSHWPRISTVGLVFLVIFDWLYFSAWVVGKLSWGGPIDVFTDPVMGGVAGLLGAMIGTGYLIGLKMGIVAWPTVRILSYLGATIVGIALVLGIFFPGFSPKNSIREAIATKPTNTEFSVLVHDTKLQGQDFQVIRNSELSWTIVFNTDEEVKILNNFPTGKVVVFSGFEYGDLYFRDGTRKALMPPSGKFKSIHNQTLRLQYKKGGKVDLNFN